MALKDQYGGRPWVDWPAPLRDRHPGQIERALDAYRQEVERHAFRQWLFNRQSHTLEEAYELCDRFVDEHLVLEPSAQPAATS